MGFHILCKQQFDMANGKTALYAGKIYIVRHISKNKGNDYEFAVASEMGNPHWFSSELIVKLFENPEKFFPEVLKTGNFDEEDIL